MDTHDLAWAAGFFDAEGSISYHLPTNRKTHRANLDVSQSGDGRAPAVLCRFRDVIGAGSIFGPYRGYIYYWRTHDTALITSVVAAALAMAQYREASADPPHARGDTGAVVGRGPRRVVVFTGGIVRAARGASRVGRGHLRWRRHRRCLHTGRQDAPPETHGIRRPGFGVRSRAHSVVQIRRPCRSGSRQWSISPARLVEVAAVPLAIRRRASRGLDHDVAAVAESGAPRASRRSVRSGEANEARGER